MTDPRKAKTLGEAAQNADGSFNLFKALSWLSEATAPGKGIPEEEVRRMAADILEKKKQGGRK